MIIPELKFYTRKSDYLSPALEVFAYKRDECGIFVLQLPSLKKLSSDDEGKSQEPFLKLSPTSAQELMDGLWDCGIRPSEGSGSAGALLATQKHLKDMQTLVFKLIDKN